MEVAIIGGMMIIVLPMGAAVKKSRSGKSFVVASSHGSRRTSARVNKQPVIVNVNAYIRSDGYVKRTRIPRRKKSSKRRRVSQRRQTEPTAPAKHHRR